MCQRERFHTGINRQFAFGRQVLASGMKTALDLGSQAAREAQAQRGALLSVGADVDLWTLGIRLVAAVLD
jgi:hypothetical protein